MKLLRLFNHPVSGFAMALAVSSFIYEGVAALRSDGTLPKSRIERKMNRTAVMTATTAPAGSPSDTQALQSLAPVVTENGYIYLSLDGSGSEDGRGDSIQVYKPVNATVRSAYLACASITSDRLPDNTVILNGSGVVWSRGLLNSINSWNHWADVTSLVKTTIDTSAAGMLRLFIVEKEPPRIIDGSALAVIFDDPNQTMRNTVILFFGGQNVAGDDFYIRYAEPINRSLSNFRLDFSLGISFSYQLNVDPKQYSIIEVNGRRLSSTAGGEDDAAADGFGLITVGGIGDSNGNPANPNATPNNCRDDDELYSLIPFVAQGDVQTRVYTKNPSNDDNIFFAALFTSATSIAGKGVLLTPVADTNAIGTFDTLTAKVQNNLGAPVKGQRVLFEILKGPHAGARDSGVTNGSGDAIYIYKGTVFGQDEIVASIRDGAGKSVFSNHAFHVWKRPGTNNPPSTKTAVSDDASLSPDIQWMYGDRDGDPQIRYEVEIWTGPGGGGATVWDPAVGSGATTSVAYSGASLAYGQRYYARVRAFDGIDWGDWSEVTWVVGRNTDSAPVAVGGPDRALPAGVSGDTAVTLDGSASYDPDGGSIVSYTWRLPSAAVMTGATATVRLTAGAHRIILTVTDDEGVVAADTVTVMVTDSAGSRNPAVKSAACFADNGRGAVDRVEIRFAGPLDSTHLPDSLRVCWPDGGDCRSVKKAAFVRDPADPAHLTINLRPSFPEEITRYGGNNGALGRAYWKSDSLSKSEAIESSFAVEDSVGPLIAAASVVERNKTAEDTIYVSFTEAVGPQSLIGSSLILIKAGAPSVIVVDAQRQGAGGFYMVSLAPGTVRPVPGDSLRINPAGPLRDRSGNSAHALNRPVFLGAREKPPSIVRAYYFDRDSGIADGIVDEAVVKFDDKADTAGLSLLFDWGSGVPLSTLQGQTISRPGPDSTLVFADLAHAFVGRPFPRTSGVMYVTSGWRERAKVPWQMDNAQVRDSAGPVIASATYLPGGEIGASDTLVVLFSEPMSPPSDPSAAPFKFVNGETAKQFSLPMSLFAFQAGDSMARFIVSAGPSTAEPNPGDSIWIDPAGGVSDAEGISQKNERNRRVPLQVNKVNSELIVKAFPNPFTAGDIASPSEVRGCAITVSTPSAKAKLSEVTGNVMIFDILGNLVFEGTLAKQTLNPPLNTCYCVVWDGNNRKRRIAGSGIYTAEVTYAVEGGRAVSKLIKIGVKR